jgi:hypothetical protein
MCLSVNKYACTDTLRFLMSALMAYGRCTISYNTYPLLMQLIFTLLLRSQHVSAIHDHHQVSTTMLKLLHCMVYHNFISKLKIKIGQL